MDWTWEMMVPGGEDREGMIWFGQQEEMEAKYWLGLIELPYLLLTNFVAWPLRLEN